MYFTALISLLSINNLIATPLGLFISLLFGASILVYVTLGHRLGPAKHFALLVAIACALGAVLVALQPAQNTQRIVNSTGESHAENSDSGDARSFEEQEPASTNVRGDETPNTSVQNFETTVSVPDKLAFSVQSDDALSSITVQPQFLDIRFESGSKTEWVILTQDSWYQIGAMTGIGNAELTIRVNNLEALTEKKYVGFIDVKSPTGEFQTKTVKLILDLTTPE